MQWRRNAPLLIAGSILALVLSLYGIFGELSIVVGMGALGALLVGVIILAATHLREGVVIPHWGVLAVAAAGFLLHMYEGAPGIGYLLWGMLPYALSAVISSFRTTRQAALGGALVTLIFDGGMHYEVFTSSRSTAVLALLWIPVWSTLIFVPAGTAVTLRLLRRRDEVKNGAP
ncbi:MAG: hypothetical protein U1F48_05530 [Burkholderiales bacterium]